MLAVLKYSVLSYLSKLNFVVEEVSPRPGFCREAFFHGWRQSSVESVHEIPVELEEADGVREGVRVFCVAFRFSNESSDSFSEDAVGVLDVRRVDIVVFGGAIDHSAHLVDDLSALFDLDELPIIHGVSSEEF